VNSERAWVIAELVAEFRQIGEQWYRFRTDSVEVLSADEILSHAFLKHRLKLTNMGRTPAHILRYQISYSCLDKGVTSLSGGTVARQDSSRVFDHLLGATGWKEVPEIVDVYQCMNERIVGIEKLDYTAVFHGWVEYLHVFNNSEVAKAPFCYVYKPSTMGLERVPEIRNKETEGD
jgi:hypothetical protein